MSKNIIIILGTTASGKTRLAARLALDMQAEVISVDSRQVYRGMDIGTGKDLQEYIVNGINIKHHLIDIISPAEEFNLFEFQRRFYEVFAALRRRNILPIAVGGTGLYLESIIQNYDMPEAKPEPQLRKELQMKSFTELRKQLDQLKPQQHNKTDNEDKERIIRAIEIAIAGKNNPEPSTLRPDIKAAVFGVRWERPVLRERITARLKQRLKEGMIEEVQRLHDSGLSWERLNSFGLEYRYLSQYLQGCINYEEMFTKLNTSIHQFAKRQETWFRRMERKGIKIDWLDGDDYQLLRERASKYLHEEA